MTVAVAAVAARGYLFAHDLCGLCVCVCVCVCVRACVMPFMPMSLSNAARTHRADVARQVPHLVLYVCHKEGAASDVQSAGA